MLEFIATVAAILAPFIALAWYFQVKENGKLANENKEMRRQLMEVRLEIKAISETMFSFFTSGSGFISEVPDAGIELGALLENNSPYMSRSGEFMQFANDIAKAHYKPMEEQELQAKFLRWLKENLEIKKFDEKS